MPFSISRSAMVFPSALAPATLPPRVDPANVDLREGSVVAAAASVFPHMPSMTCAYICDTLRNTRSRSRSGVPAIRLRCLSAIRVRRSFVVLIFISQLPVASCQLPVTRKSVWKLETGNWRLFCARLSSLLLQHFAGVADALLLVGIRLAQTSNVRGHLSDRLAIDAGHRDVRLLVDGDVDSRRNVEHHRVRVAQREHHLLPSDFGTVPDADDVEVLAEAFGDTAHRVGHQAAGEAVELPELRILAQRPRVELISLHLESDTGRQQLPQLPLRPLDFHSARLRVNLDALRDRDWFFSYA